MPAMDDDRKYRNVGRINAWDTRGLRQRFRVPLLELFAAFITDRWALVILKPRWNTRILIAPCPLRRYLLLTDLPFILAQDEYLIPNRFRKIFKV